MNRQSSSTFCLGRIVATKGALAACQNHSVSPLDLLRRHAAEDWGDLCIEDLQANSHAIRSGERLLSAYRISRQERIWIITEADRSATTLLLPEEY
ncbi:MAG: hypothetical protein ACN6O8_18325 [Achromobacter sp.]|uniref:hypothetical protein n=1 Tax=Achromobacter sp. TaxID=134375 RepID=UPI003D06BD34